MSWSNFCTHFLETVSKKRSNYVLRLNPNLNRLPLPIQRFDEPLFPFSKELITATSQYIGVYIFDLSTYITTGAAGIVALERSIAYARSRAITILDGPFIGNGYGSLTDVVGLNVDSFTVAKDTDAKHYISNPPYTCFLWCSDSISDGGCIDDEALSLFQNGTEIQRLLIMDSESLLTDLSETYAETIIKQIDVKL